MKVTIATRGSALALWQANTVRDQLTRVGWDVDLLVLKTQGDRILHTSLAKIGGKGLFVKELEQALLDGRAQLAVHSMKDVPYELTPGTSLDAALASASPFDALCGATLDTLKQQARIGTSSLRRSSQLLAMRPDLTIVPVRGNVETRLSKLENREVDAVVLAEAGLRRLGLAENITEVLSPDVCLPAAGQGVLGIQTADQKVAKNVREVLNEPLAEARILAERACVRALNGSCQTPVAAHAMIVEEQLQLRALVASEDGERILRAEETGSLTMADELGRKAGDALLKQGAHELLVK